MAVTGAILGDIAGSRFEFYKPENLDYLHCPLFDENHEFTDDTVMTLAVKKAIREKLDLTETIREVGRHYPDCGYGGHFVQWLFMEDPKPYNSYGNGSAMRVSFVGEYYEELADVIRVAEETAAVSHNHPEGIKGAVVTAVCIWMARHGKTKQEIYDYVAGQYPDGKYSFGIDKDMEYLARHYTWDVTCMTSVPVAMRCFYESDSFESFMRNIFRLDCDSDTLGAIGGAVAEEFYHGAGFDPEPILRKYLDQRLYAMWKE
mgnify:CR=1 FL=1